MVDGFNGLNGRSGGLLGIVGGFGLGEVAGVIGGAVARGYLLAVAVSGKAGGVAVIVCLNSDCSGFTNGVVEGEGDGFNHSVVNGVTVGLLHHGLAASATHCRQGKRHYEGSRYFSVSHFLNGLSRCVDGDNVRDGDG